MVQFEKNGQGFWDFDFEALAALTTVEFVEEIQYELKKNSLEILDVEFVDGLYFIDVIIYSNNIVQILTFDKELNTYKRSIFGVSIIKNISNRLQKLGVIND